ncbi:hypothetical protein AB1Y20_022698 [Prymnesium parvum]|uniref:Cyclin N-terminal domain-containing protein n=1 Tax=Prymnesium parvum TaxID=97485 RepID=A0AB34JGZ6_PRYPA
MSVGRKYWVAVRKAVFVRNSRQHNESQPELTSEKPRLRRSHSSHIQLPSNDSNSKEAPAVLTVKRATSDRAVKLEEPVPLATPTRLDLLVSLAVILCDYGGGVKSSRLRYTPSKMLLRVFSEEQQPVNDSSCILNYESALDFITTLASALEVDGECIVFAVVILERVGRDVLKSLMTQYYWRKTMITVFALACKLWYDESTWLVDVRTCLESYNIIVDKLHRQEAAFLKLINFNATMSPTTYASYVFPMLSVRLRPEAQLLVDQYKAKNKLHSSTKQTWSCSTRA